MEDEGDPQTPPDDGQPGGQPPVKLRVVIRCNLMSGEVTIDLVNAESVIIETHKERDQGTSNDPGKPPRP